MCQLLYHDGVYTTEVSVVLEIFQAHVIMTFLKTVLKGWVKYWWNVDIWLGIKLFL